MLRDKIGKYGVFILKRNVIKWGNMGADKLEIGEMKYTKFEKGKNYFWIRHNLWTGLLDAANLK